MSRSSGHYEEAVDGSRAGLGVGIPETPKLRSRSINVFGAIEVAHHRFTPGEIETLPFKGPVVNLHLNTPHRLVQRQDGKTRGGLVATNDAAITPAGMPGYWRTDAASEDMSMLLESGFIRRVATETGVEPKGVELVPLFSAPEPQIERIGLSLLSEMETGGLGGELYAESLATLLALHLLRNHSSLGRGSRRRIGREGGYSKRALGQATDYINDTHDDDEEGNRGDQRVRVASGPGACLCPDPRVGKPGPRGDHNRGQPRRRHAGHRRELHPA